MVLGEYLIRRILRLWPAFLGAWILAGVTVSIIHAVPTWWPSSLPVFTWNDWFLQAFIVYWGSDSYNFAWWTLTIEVLFYAASPLIVFLISGSRELTLISILILSCIVAQISTNLGSTNDARPTLLNGLSFASCFMGGVYLAMHEIPISWRFISISAGAAIIISSTTFTQLNTHIGFGLFYFGLISESMDKGSALHTMLSHPTIVWIGERSYSIFLTHYSAIAIACWLTSMLITKKSLAYFMTSRLLSFPLILIFSCLLFEFVEARFARGLLTAGMWIPRRASARAIASPHPRNLS
jgi:peptidoglycan/LPS O-acetylase OafA/YrhL